MHQRNNHRYFLVAQFLESVLSPLAVCQEVLASCLIMYLIPCNYWLNKVVGCMLNLLNRTSFTLVIVFPRINITSLTTWIRRRTGTLPESLIFPWWFLINNNTRSYRTMQSRVTTWS
ncbi:uncharacterized protein B0H64DRAFT_82797 [Chaetomium fimeti]|uniref:Uncharacterized protein n=1 Tax=Chaetomium fimeti TaxID=1854472 RepID=A0AAE0HLL4_9PEZI|nr:hypothetical protein B0H64DRAFT_82797 [Chaetomium fimeti]